ncbi:MAG: hypothetical protein J6W81_01520, partial [Lentisphaeria bacterium]|nr:hypothetical protein [Lentisphaeria bacterium]
FTFRGPDGKKETFKLTIPKGKSVVKKIVCKFPEKVGFVELDAELKIGDVVKHNRISVMVRPPYPLTSQSIFKMLKPGEHWNLSGENLPVFIGKTDYTVSFSASPGLALKDALSWLNDYPYGCLEQTVSAAFPLFSVDTLLKLGLISQEMADTAKAKLTPAAAKLRSMQLADGSFAAWPGSMERWVDASVFALHFLSECNSYPQDRITQNFLRGLAEDTGKSRFSRAYACYVLALRKDDAFLQNARNLIKSPKDDFATFLAACALIEGHYAGEAFPILKRVLEKEVWRNPAELPYYCNTISCMGMALRLLMKYDHESPAVGKLVAELQKKLRNDGSGWGTTQSNAWAVLGLSSFVREFGGAAGNVAIDIGKEKMLALSLTRPQKQVLDAAQLKKCVVKNTGKSAVYVQLNVSGYPKTLEDHSRVMKISRKITNASGKKVSSAKQGDLLTVVWEIESSAAVEDVVIADLLPGGLEIEDDRLASRMNMRKDKKTKGQQIRIKHLEKQTGLFLVFGNISAGKTTFRYQARAVSSGVYSPGAIRAEAMYEPDNTAVSSVKDKFVVK